MRLARDDHYAVVCGRAGFQTLAEARRIIGEFIARYNTEWLIERLGHQTPVAARMTVMAA